MVDNTKKVVKLGVVPVDVASDISLIEILERALKEAKNGILKGVVVALIRKDGSPSALFAGSASMAEAIGAMQIAQFDLYKELEDPDMVDLNEEGDGEDGEDDSA